MNWSRVLRPVWSLTALALALSLLAVPMGARAQDDDDDDDDSPRQGTVRIYERNDRNDRDERGRSEGGYLGVQVQDVTRTLQRARNLPTDEGALVSRVEQDSPADRNGIRRGDVIVEVDGEKIDDSRDLIRVVRGIDPGKNSRITLWRAGSLRTVNVQLGDRPQGRPNTPPDMGRWPMPGGDDEDRVIQLPPSNDDRDQLRQQIRELRAQLDRLRAEIRAMRSETRSHDNDDDDDDDDRRRNDRDD